jgi:hypothetical protein
VSEIHDTVAWRFADPDVTDRWLPDEHLAETIPPTTSASPTGEP